MRESPAEHDARGGEALQRITRPPPMDAPPPSLPAEERARLANANVGMTVKGWRLARLLGVGPVTAAYEATRGANDGARAVLRLMIGTAAAHERSRAQFLRAAYSASRFQHPRVLPAIEDGTDASGAPFVVRAWSDGEPLADIVRRGPLGEGEVLKIAEQVLDALEIAHAHGVVHGAIGPSNVLVTPRGSVRVCDFATPPGLSSHASDEDDVLAARRIGPFAAPERCDAAAPPATEAADVYALGATMFFALTGQAPRVAETPEALAKAAARPIRDVLPGIGEGLAHVVDHALCSDPARRYESAYAMLGDVRRVLAGRAPKLGAAMKPNPSGSYSGGAITSRQRLSLPPSRVESSVARPSMLQRELLRRKKEWKGNVALILAIALLVGIATFVMVREKVEEERQQDNRAAPR